MRKNLANYIRRLADWVDGENMSSKELAKERLQVILKQERLFLNNEQLNKLKEDIARVIDKYVKVQDNIEISLSGEGRTVSLITTAIVGQKK